MIKNLFFLLAFMLSSLLFGQDKIEGIGIFKLGKNKTEILNELKGVGYGVNLLSKAKTYVDLENSSEENKKPMCYLVDIDETYYTPITVASLSAKHQVYFINYYKVDGMVIKNIRLDFYNNKLYIIYTDKLPAIFSNNLRLKYGIYKQYMDRKDMVCHKDNEPYTKEDATFFTYYRLGYITSVEVSSSFYDSTCNPKFVNYFKIVNNDIIQIVLDEEKELNENKNKAIENTQLGKLF